MLHVTPINTGMTDAYRSFRNAPKPGTNLGHHG